MKQWLNNWEKKIGDRLRTAQSRPQGHVWDLIGQELDNQAAERRPVTWRRTAAMALIATLLLVSGALLTSQPGGDTAYNFNRSFPADMSHDQWIVSGPSGIDEIGFSGGEVSGNVVETIVADASAERIDLENDGATVSLPEPVIPELEVIEPSITQVVDDAIQPGSMESVFQDELAIKGEDEFRSVLPAIEDRLLEHELNVLESPLMPRGQELLNRIAAHANVESDLLVRSDDPELQAYQNISQLAMQSAEVEVDPEIDPSSELSINEAISDFKDADEIDAEEIDLDVTDEEVIEQGEELALVEEQKEVVEEIIEVASKETVSKQSVWIAEALEDLEAWKSTLPGEDAEGELEELIDEAVIDEEDPLTKRQNATKDLYRAHNINKGFHIGMVTGFTTTWVTRASRNPEVDRSYVDYRMNPGYQIGLNMGYDITEHFGLMTEFKYSDEGGRYFHPLRNREQQIDLRYIELPVYAKVKHSKLSEKMRPLVFNYLVGVTYKDLRTINVSNGGNKDQRFGQDYNTSEWGLSAGFDFDFYINKNFFWTIGSRAGVSGNAKDFPRFKGEDGEGPLSISAGIYTRINFRLPGK